MSQAAANSLDSTSAAAGEYTVIARRYRPETFDQLIGQEHVAQALSGAIAVNRVGHAYLFAGARGVGKTSAARILAKALNCRQGPAPVPCNRCDICRRIGVGEDVDVLEIDGASNRGIDEIRQLRQNVNVRPSRARLKIYIIDEVHMLTREAFNALLKTLEEPPEHVKFVFCTTEPTKVPLTILSRCQRYDFAGITWESIAGQLRRICDAEGVEADPEALDVLARRATGSMRDGQSLLEQLLAFAPGRITLEDVHGMLGTASDRRLAELGGHLAERDAAAALATLERALREGVDVAQLLEQLFGYFRDCMAAAAGCPAELLLYASPRSHQEVADLGKRLGLTTLLAAMQILEQTLARLRLSTHGRILAELALVRICSLEDLDELPALIAELRSGAPGGRAAADRPKAAANSFGSSEATQQRHPSSQAPPPPEPRGGMPSPPPGALTPENAAQVWTAALARISGMVAEHAKRFDQVALSAPDRLVISFKPGYALAKSFCERPDQTACLEQALTEVTGRRIGLGFALQQESAPTQPVRPASARQRLREVAEHPMIRRAGELFGAQPVRVDEPPGTE